MRKAARLPLPSFPVGRRSGQASPALIGSNPEEAHLRSQLEVVAQDEEFYCLAQ